MKGHGSVKKDRIPAAQTYRTLRPHELSPDGTDHVWQMDATCFHSPGLGWRDATMGIDSRSQCFPVTDLTRRHAAVAEAASVIADFRRPH